MTTAALIVAAGRGTRAGGDVPKQWQDLNGEPVIARTYRALAAEVDLVAVVLHPDDQDRWDALDLSAITARGGATRGASVRAGLQALESHAPDTVLIHDAARPFVSTGIIRAVLAALQTHDGAAPGLPVTDALWTGSSGLVTGTQDRDGLFAAQTPQGFRFDAILAAHLAHQGDAADDVAVARAAGLTVAIVPGEAANFKITAPEDLSRARRAAGGRMDIRMGNGYDVHAFGPGDHVWLCGVRVPHDHALMGHSDADVGMHAITDAIYGALGQGDIGQHFPPSDPQWKGAESHIFLRHACDLAKSQGYEISNVDCTLVCEYPKVGPHQDAMRKALADIMNIAPDRISAKATTSEKLGFTGRSEGIAALATATLVKS